MRHQNSVLHGLLKHVPWAAFDRLVSEHDADARVRRLPTKAQFIALLYGQLAGAASLREIETALSSHAARLYHAGGSAVARSTLADANASRPAELFAALLARMMAQAGGGLRRTVGEAVRLIDATGIRLAGLGSEWARFSAQACGAKLHVVYDPDADRPPPSAPPGSTTSPSPRRCRSSPAPPMSSTSATTPMAGGPNSTLPVAASSPASRRTRRST
jgi:hypothetical protein